MQGLGTPYSYLRSGCAFDFGLNKPRNGNPFANAAEVVLSRLC